jgi:hypothetical protein
MEWIKITFLISAILHLKVDAWPFGAPLEACDNMIPGHDPFQPQIGEPPVDIVVSKWAMFPNEKITITIRSNFSVAPTFQFRGFLVQARPLSENTPIGRFSPAAGVNPINCFGMIQSAVTHTDAADKNEIVFEWEAPDISDPLVFEL